jgi:PAS domain-containing protein
MTAKKELGEQLKEAEERLRESQEQIKALFEFSSDWYWEQDADFRFTLIKRKAASEVRFGAQQSIGNTRWELSYLGITEDQWAEHRALLSGPERQKSLTNNELL